MLGRGVWAMRLRCYPSFLRILLVGIFIGLIAAPIAAIDRFVPSQYQTIQDAVDDSLSGDRILVSPGFYPGSVDLLGKSLMLIGIGGQTLTTIQGVTAGSLLTIVGNQGPSTVIQGFTFSEGIGQSVGAPPQLVGGAIYVRFASPTILDCHIVGNEATNGGGIYLDTSGASISGLTFTQNSAAEGGAILAVDSLPTIENCSFNSNTAFGRGGAIQLLRSPAQIQSCTLVGNSANRGGAISCSDSDIEMIDGLVASNVAIEHGGGISLEDFSDAEITDVSVLENEGLFGGGIGVTHFSNAVITDVEILDNISGEGGGIRIFESSPQLNRVSIRRNVANGSGMASGEGGGIYMQLRSDPVIRSTLIAENQAVVAGGGLFCRWESEPLLVHVTIADNHANQFGGGIALDHYSIAEFWNSILWGNTSPVDQTISVDPESDFSFQFTDAEGGFPGEGNLNLDPLLTADYELDLCSPVIDMGTFSAPMLPPLDIAGHMRSRGLRPDFGSWESPPGTGGCFVRGDANQDSVINVGDVATSLNYLFSGFSTLTCLDAVDVDDSGFIDIADPIKLLGFLFLGDAPPLPPEPTEPAPDPTEDSLHCDLGDFGL